MLKYSNPRSPESDTSETARQNRCHSPCGFHFPLPWLLSSEAGDGHRAKFRLQTAKQPVTGSLVAMQGRSFTVPCMAACPVPCKSLTSGRAPPPPHLHCCLCCCCCKNTKHDPSWQFGAALELAQEPGVEGLYPSSWPLTGLATAFTGGKVGLVRHGMGQGGSCLSQSLEDVTGKIATAQQCVFLHLSLGQDLHYGKVKQRNTSPPGWGLAF